MGRDMGGAGAVPSSQDLVDEHRVILTVLRALEQRIAGAARSGSVPVAFLRDVLEFSQQFIDRCHHGKEEGCLFPCLEQRGMAREGGLLLVLQDEHAAGRALVGRIAVALDRYARGEAAAAEVLDPCQAYADLLRQHIRKEDDVLFPMSDGLLAVEDHAGTTRCYAEREAGLGPGEHRRLEHLAHRLAGDEPSSGEEA